jgi:O-methyltransferase
VNSTETNVMKDEDFAKLLEDLETELLRGAQSVAVLGWTRTTLRLLGSLAATGLVPQVSAIFAPGRDVLSLPASSLPVRPLRDLATTVFDVVVVADDSDKEELILAALPYIQGAPKLIVAGYGHLGFADDLFHEELAQLLVPSLANGYPNSLIHLYQCLRNASRLGLHGVVAEFGMFKGGTTMFVSRVIERLGCRWPVIGFDTFGGFPDRRSPLDMYDHPGCVFTDVSTVQRYLEGRNVEIVTGDIVESCRRLADESMVVSFIDTDNYTPAAAALNIVRDRTVVGGAIVFDHFTGVDRFRYTLGERLAARELLEDPRYFHLHDTGVFYRQS